MPSATSTKEFFRSILQDSSRLPWLRPRMCNIMHADGAGTKSALAYAYWRRTGDLSVWKGIAQDAMIMNIDDLLCVGATDNILPVVDHRTQQASGSRRGDSSNYRRHRTARRRAARDLGVGVYTTGWRDRRRGRPGANHNRGQHRDTAACDVPM